MSAAFARPDEAWLVERIRSSGQYIAELALVATLGEDIVGHVMISGAELQQGAAAVPIAILAPLAVAPAHQGCGFGSTLVRTACAAANQRGEPLVVLEGNPAYYARFGFEPAYLHGIELPLPSWAQREAGQVLRLDAYEPDLRGPVVYPPAFDEVADRPG